MKTKWQVRQMLGDERQRCHFKEVRSRIHHDCFRPALEVYKGNIVRVLAANLPPEELKEWQQKSPADLAEQIDRALKEDQLSLSSEHRELMEAQLQRIKDTRQLFDELGNDQNLEEYYESLSDVHFTHRLLKHSIAALEPLVALLFEELERRLQHYLDLYLRFWLHHHGNQEAETLGSDQLHSLCVHEREAVFQALEEGFFLDFMTGEVFSELSHHYLDAIQVFYESQNIEAEDRPPVVEAEGSYEQAGILIEEALCDPPQLARFNKVIEELTRFDEALALENLKKMAFTLLFDRLEGREK